MCLKQWNPTLAIMTRLFDHPLIHALNAYLLELPSSLILINLLRLFMGPFNKNSTDNDRKEIAEACA